MKPAAVTQNLELQRHVSHAARKARKGKFEINQRTFLARRNGHRSVGPAGHGFIDDLQRILKLCTD